MKHLRAHWLLILGTGLLVYVLWLGAHDSTAGAGTGGVNAPPKTNDLDGLMDAATSGTNTVVIAGETVKLVD